MCLVRIDYDATLPTGEITAYKVFRQWDDGRITAAYRDTWKHVELGVWQIASVDKRVRNKRTRYRRTGMSYPVGFHASRYDYACKLAEYLNERDVRKARELRTLQLQACQYRTYTDWNGEVSRYWLDAGRSPLDSTVQDPAYKYVVLPVQLRGVHTVGRQEFQGKTYRTWVASEQYVQL